MREKCFQFEMREREAKAEPRAPDRDIDYTIETIGAEEATAFIKRYEWLGTPGHPIARYCARNWLGDIAAVALFGRSAVQSAGLCRKITPASVKADPEDLAYFHKVACLERGACAHWAHPHTGSWFIPQVLKRAHDDHGWEIFYAYSDEEAGEIGTIYQACNWLYLGLGATRYLNRKKQPPTCRWVFQKMKLVNGEWMPDSKWVQSREFYSQGCKVGQHVGVGTDLTGEPIRNKNGGLRYQGFFTTKKPWALREAIAKHKYVQFVGDKATRRKWTKALRSPCLPYPKRPS